MGSINLPDKLLSAVKRLAEARGIPAEAWVREAVTVAIASEILPVDNEDPPPPVSAAPALKDSNGVKEVADYLNVSPHHLYNVIASGRLGSVRVGTLVRIKREHVEAFLRENTREAKKGESNE